MMYFYEAERPSLFTDAGQRMFLKIRDHVKTLLSQSGAFMMEKALVGSGSSWEMLACVDRLVELGEIMEVTPAGSVAGQYRVFIKSYK